MTKKNTHHYRPFHPSPVEVGEVTAIMTMKDRTYSLRRLVGFDLLESMDGCQFQDFPKMLGNKRRGCVEKTSRVGSWEGQKHVQLEWINEFDLAFQHFTSCSTISKAILAVQSTIQAAGRLRPLVAFPFLALSVAMTYTDVSLL